MPEPVMPASRTWLPWPVSRSSDLAPPRSMPLEASAGRGCRVRYAGPLFVVLVLAALGSGCSGQMVPLPPGQESGAASAAATLSSSAPNAVVGPAATDAVMPLATEASDLGAVARDADEDAAVRAPVSSPPITSSPLAASGSALKRPQFVEAAAPSWPFEGVVQLWSYGGAEWSLRYWSQGLDAEVMPQVPLPGLEIECLGQVGMVSHGERGIEVGGVRGAVSGAYVVPWGGAARRLEEPSDALLAEIDSWPSTLKAGSMGDVVWLEADGQRVSYAMRQPARQAGDWWRVQARHDGDLLVLSVHPANHECFSGVTWLVDGSSGEVVGCGANTWATRFVAPDDHRVGGLVLPDPDDVGTYLGCGARLELSRLPIRADG